MKKLLTVLFTLVFAACLPLAEAAQHQKTKRPATHSVKVVKAHSVKAYPAKHPVMKGKKVTQSKKAVLTKKAHAPHKPMKAKKLVVRKHH